MILPAHLGTSTLNPGFVDGQTAARRERWANPVVEERISFFLFYLVYPTETAGILPPRLATGTLETAGLSGPAH
jgi:hypothetical protein